MAKETNMMPIDGKKLESAFKRRGIPMTQASQEIGFATSYLGNCVALGRIRKAAVHTLKSLYNIEYNDIAPNHEPEEAPKQPEKQVGESGIDYEKMYRMIYCAVYEAFKKALAE